jgi:hypothetical protein
LITHDSWWDSSGQGIGPSQRPLPDNTHHSRQRPCLRRDSNAQSQQTIGRRPLQYGTYGMIFPFSQRMHNSAPSLMPIVLIAVKVSGIQHKLYKSSFCSADSSVDNVDYELKDRVMVIRFPQRQYIFPTVNASRGPPHLLFNE